MAKTRIYGTGILWNPTTNKVLINFPPKGYIETDNEEHIKKAKAKGLETVPVAQAIKEAKSNRAQAENANLPNNLLILRGMAKKMNIENYGDMSIPELKKAILNKRISDADNNS